MRLADCIREYYWLKYANALINLFWFIEIHYPVIDGLRDDSSRSEVRTNSSLWMTFIFLDDTNCNYWINWSGTSFFSCGHRPYAVFKCSVYIVNKISGCTGNFISSTQKQFASEKCYLLILGIVFACVGRVFRLSTGNVGYILWESKQILWNEIVTK